MLNAEYRDMSSHFFVFHIQHPVFHIVLQLSFNYLPQTNNRQLII